MEQFKRVGENGLDRAVRLLKLLNTHLSDPDTEGMEELRLDLGPDGDGRVIGVACNTLFSFSSTGELMDFLGAKLSAQVSMIRNNA